MVTFDPPLPDTVQDGDSGHIADTNSIIAALTALNNGKPDSSSAVLKSLIDAKGDLIIGTAADTPARLAVGVTNGHVLTVDSTQAAGMKWAAATGGADGAATGVIDVVRDYGALGDGLTDDTTAIQNALTAGSGLTVYIPTGVYKLTDELDVAAETTVIGPGILKQTGTAKNALVLNGSDITIEGIGIQGRHSSDTYYGGEYGIYCVGTSTSSRKSNIVIRNVEISRFGHTAVSLIFVDEFEVTGCYIHDVGYAGVQTQSASKGRISNNRIDNIGPGTDSNMYGISLTVGGGAAADWPSSSDIVVDGNLITNVDWEHIDSHGGQNLVISNNVLLGTVSNGAMIALPGVDDTRYLRNIVVTGNVLNSLTDPDETSKGMTVAGESTSIPCQGLVISGNTFIRTGTIMMWNVEGGVIANNNFVEPRQTAIWLEDGCTDVVVSGNSCTDVWELTSVTGNVGFMFLAANDLTANVFGNVMIDGGRPATGEYQNVYGVNAFSYTGCSVNWGINDFNIASSNAFYPAGLVKTGFMSEAPIAKPTVTGSRSSNAALASLCTALADLGLITDSTS